jgi:hypothetical protein
MFDLCPGLDVQVVPIMHAHTRQRLITLQLLRVAVFEVREAESADIMQYYPMFTPSPVFMSTIVAHFKRVCRHRTPTCNLRYHRNAVQSGCSVAPNRCLSGPCSSYTLRLPQFSHFAACLQETPSFCSACRHDSRAQPRDRHSSPSRTRLHARDIVLNLAMHMFFCVSMSWQTKGSFKAEAEASDDDSDFIAAGSSCMWMQR